MLPYGGEHQNLHNLAVPNQITVKCEAYNIELTYVHCNMWPREDASGIVDIGNVSKLI